MRTPILSELPPVDGAWIEIDVSRQCLSLWQGEQLIHICDISTAQAGTGQQEGSGRTPLGWHYIRAAIGRDVPLDGVFRGRRFTGEVYSDALAKAHPARDWILTRILWLCGLETGVNRGACVDSQRRYIYLHGTPPDQSMGVARSHGCIRMRNADLVLMVEKAPPGTPVWLHE
ncbi:L,D-transpeptidase family protein [Halomonas sp. ZH2S]|uniref:L,D-transpeptidase family protein n=1 Tax=Vreelandella zhuhanensis TaxID=2684210 RepID=A0A7X3GZ49_9GAMM|nr:L,D-transpeptidase [Halomonas zhuhanensis]MWJ26633.1 L,D-transpeptidase family protein [Halomonas zhuhanensis]